MLDESIRIVGHVGDRDPLNDGGVILDHGDGRPTLLYLVSVEGGPKRYDCEACGGVCTLEFYKYGADILDIDDIVNGEHAWADAADVARSCGWDEAELRGMARSENLTERCHAIMAVAGYYGRENFDGQPYRMHHDEAEAWAAALEEDEKRPPREQAAKKGGR